MRVHSESEKWTKTSNLEPRTEPNPEASEMCLKKAMAAHSISFFWSASLCIWKIRLASTLTLRHTYTHTGTGNAMASCSVQLVNGRNGFLTDLWLSSPSLPHFWIIAIEIDERNFVFLSPFSCCFFFFRYALPPAHWVLWFGFGLDSFWAAPLLTGQEKEAGLWQVSFQCRAPSYLGQATRRVCCNFSLPFFLSFLSFGSLETHVAEHTLSRKMLLSQKTLLCFVRSLGLS